MSKISNEKFAPLKSSRHTKLTENIAVHYSIFIDTAIKLFLQGHQSCLLRLQLLIFLCQRILQRLVGTLEIVQSIFFKCKLLAKLYSFRFRSINLRGDI